MQNKSLTYSDLQLNLSLTQDIFNLKDIIFQLTIVVLIQLFVLGI
jgi:hypothetical protein